MAKLSDLREKYPQYNDMNDREFADAFHKKYYSDIPANKFYEKIGLSPSSGQELTSEQQHWKSVERVLQNLLKGTSETGRNVGNFFANMIGKNLPEPNYEAAFGIPKNREETLADKLTQSVPELATAVALPAAKVGSLIPQAGKYLKTALNSPILGNTLSQGLFAATQSPEKPLESGLQAGGIVAPFSAAVQGVSSASPLTRNLARGLMASGLGGIGYYGARQIGLPDPLTLGAGGLMGLAGWKGLNTKRKITEDILKGIENTDYPETLDAAKRLGLSYITPAEASGSPYTGAIQGKLGKTPEGAQLLLKKGAERASSEQQSIQNLLNTVFEPGKEKSISELYKEAYTKKVPTDVFGLQSNEIFQDAVKKMLKDPAYRQELKGVPKNSVEYLDIVKRQMGDMIESQTDNFGRITNKGRIIGKTQKELVKGLDKFAPAYQEARSLAERKIARQGIEDVFDKKRMEGTPMAQFLKSESGYEELQHHLRNIPEAQQQLADMKKVFHRLINIPTAKTAETLARSSMSGDRASMEHFLREWKEALSGGKYDKTAIELITNPKWIDELEKLKDTSNMRKFIGGSVDLIGKATAQGTTKNDQ